MFRVPGPKFDSKSAPNWPPRQPKRPPRRPKRRPRRPKRPPRRPKRPQGRPKRPPRRPKRPPKTAQEAQDGPRGPQDRPRGPKTAPRRPQDGPRRPKTAPRRLQDRPKTAPRPPPSPSKTILLRRCCLHVRFVDAFFFKCALQEPRSDGRRCSPKANRIRRPSPTGGCQQRVETSIENDLNYVLPGGVPAESFELFKVVFRQNLPNNYFY